MAVAADQQTKNMETWVLAAEAYPELEARARLRVAESVGPLALNQQVEIIPVEEDSTAEITDESTLLVAIQRAAAGDKESEQVVDENVFTEIGERLFKIGVSEVDMQAVDGQLIQHGRRLVDVNKNNLRHSVLMGEMQYRSEIELGNSYLFEELYNAGVTDTHDVAVFSPAPTNQQILKDYRFYLGTESCSIQLLQARGDNLKFQTAMVAGKKTAASPRHDLQAIQDMAAAEGIEIATQETSEFLQYVMLIPKGQLPNGVNDVVRRYDQASGGTFFGQDKPAQDYEAFAQDCKDRALQFTDIADQIKQQLLDEAHLYKTPLEVIRRLDHLSERLCVKRARYDHSIDAAIFGEVAARHIADARYFESIGQQERANMSMRDAQKTAKSGGCPLFDQNKEGDDPLNPNASGDDEPASEKRSMTCPFCSATVYDDPCAKQIICWDCRAEVRDGKVRYEGNGGTKKRRADREAAKQAALAKESETQKPPPDPEPKAENQIEAPKTTGVNC